MPHQVKTFRLRAAHKLSSTHGTVNIGDELALISCAVPPADLASWLMYGHLEAVEDPEIAAETQDDFCLSRKDPVPVKPPEAATTEPDGDESEVEATDTGDAGSEDEGSDASGTNQTEGGEGTEGDDDNSNQGAEGDNVPAWLSPLGLDGAINGALIADETINSLEDLDAAIVEGRQISGIGKLRREAIEKALAVYHSADPS